MCDSRVVTVPPEHPRALSPRAPAVMRSASRSAITFARYSVEVLTPLKSGSSSTGPVA